jgi:hypothetical protein
LAGQAGHSRDATGSAANPRNTHARIWHPADSGNTDAGPPSNTGNADAGVWHPADTGDTDAGVRYPADTGDTDTGPPSNTGNADAGIWHPADTCDTDAGSPADTRDAHAGRLTERWLRVAALREEQASCKNGDERGAANTESGFQN